MSRERPRRAALPPAQENIEKLQKIINDGNYYGAQQMYKSNSVRYISAERHSEALDILESGAYLQLKHEQVTCGAELANLFVDTLVKGKIPYSDDMLDRIRKIYKAFPRNAVPDHVGDDDDMQKLSEALAAAKIRVDGCSSFLKAAIRWSIEFGADKNGTPELHAMLAEYIYSECPEVDMARVSFHFVRGNSPKKFASILANFMERCYPGEDDVAIARAVLMYLALGNLRDANYLVDEIKKQLESKEVEFPQSDLMQLINYLLRTLERDALPLFRMLRQNYKSSIDRDPAFNELLDEIAEKFYGVKRKNPMQGMFGDIFKVTCGAELANLFVDTLVKGKIPYSDDMLDRLRKIYKAFPRNAVPDHVGDDDDMQKLSEALAAAKIRVDGCSSFLKAAIRWSIEFGADKNGSPELHAMLAEYIYSECPEVDMTRVTFHFVRGNSPKKFASILANFMERCYPGEDDVAIARAVLMYLALGNLRDANYLVDEIKKQLESKEVEFPQSDLMQLINYLLRTLERDALPLFRMLRQNYKSSIDRDPAFNELLDEIAEKFYGVKRKNPMQGMFGDIFKMMGGDMGL